MSDSTTILTLLLPDEAATLRLGGVLAEVVAAGILFLRGDLGSGKTTLSRGLLHGLGHQGAVKSPTYTLVEPYLLSELALYHFDLYRLADEKELEYLGVRDYFREDSLCLIEWPERGEPLLPSPDLEIRLKWIEKGRWCEIEGCSDRGRMWLAQLRCNPVVQALAVAAVDDSA
ncbi:MAG: tRNA (adenosine(37)-N6)-threonylcarbamoyltransferase complex ATPase subunit type 1 TsaE [Pseudomonadales bacterium]|jgi:tRNA threonylcarbamoyladenosine biosynthesis protein TsaE|nr:tRNA (adenosine(37)-N6)-threonylcarbamoyltransferase complex ATPase subunit type 1 TsaE [Pseudomonadales bacterium]HNB84617.1 tRNA (adenosine(37)-N6)-threonylcarbamoyltransferase complex ATPase subunit type 1 TsaE [Pseudomonadales bacterium]HNF08986.1 tRNA (adenosine(37)-N6)-threonylcarbamoyltransferase complex ATPase subunit type 1 TsaE [Pseudomonadales bacterium]HNL32678.1 tRNA (adenosine(37)-N6)-threonylcarbamoyltransferase complex ATPase subunit type 1 TsaE [Pseudomonadales bacterium]HNV